MNCRKVDATRTPENNLIGILSPGELGVALARILRTSGYDIVTTLHGRSARTETNCQRCGIKVLPQLADVVNAADIVLSTVTPAAALSMAVEVRRAASRQNRKLVYIDVNSVSPQTIDKITEMFVGSPVSMVDAAVHGLADRLPTHGTIYASGANAAALVQLFEPQIRIRLLGREPGIASLMKMSLGGMSKGIIGLFLQSSLLAHHAGVAEEFTDELGRYYPDVRQFIERSLPTYPQHAGRRAEEMRELTETLQLANQPTGIAAELSDVFSRLAANHPAINSAAPVSPPSVQELITLFAEGQSTIPPRNPDTPQLCT